MRFKSGILAPLGTSPPVVTELLDYLFSLGERVSDVTVLITAEPLVKVGVPLVKAAVGDRYPEVRVHVKSLPFVDVGSVEEYERFVVEVAGIMRDEFVQHRVSRLFINLAGGRKNMASSLTLLAQLFNVASVFHIVHRDVKAFNAYLERVRRTIEKVAEAEDPFAEYGKHREELEPLMYPSPEDYRVIEMPVIPIPRSVVRALARLEPITDRKGLRISERYLRDLRRRGLIKLTPNKIYLEDKLKPLVEAARLAAETFT